MTTKPDRVFSEINPAPIVLELVRLCRELLDRLERAEFELAKLDGLVAGLGSCFIGDRVPEDDYEQINQRLRAVWKQVEYHNQMHPVNDATRPRDQWWLNYLRDRALALDRGGEEGPPEQQLPS